MLAKDLRAKRAELDLTQPELAEHWGLTRNTIMNWEREHTPLPKWVPDALVGLEQRLVKARQAYAKAFERGAA